MRKRSLCLSDLVLLAFPLAGFGCEPIFPLTQLLSGCTLASPMFLTKSLICLAVAVSIKCVAFVFLEPRLPWIRAVGYMLFANVLSTIPGVLIAVSAGSVGLGIILGVPIVGFLGLLLGRRLKLLGLQGETPLICGGKAAFLFTGFFIASVYLYGLAASALNTDSFATYWFLKFVFVTMVAATGIVISTVLEEGTVARLSRKVCGNVSFYTSVWRSNYITLGFVLLVAALQMLAKRMVAPHFLASWLHSLSVVLGLS